MNANAFFRKCNDIIAGVTAPSAVTSFAEDDFAEDDFVEDIVENPKEGAKVHRIQAINFKTDSRQVSTFAEYVKEDVAPGEWEHAIEYWNFAHNKNVTTEEELCRAFAAERYAVTFSADVNVSELNPDDVISRTASRVIVTNKELSGVNDDGDCQELREICGFQDNYTPTDFILGVYSAYKEGQIGRFDLRRFALFSCVYDCSALLDRKIKPFNEFLISELCNRIGVEVPVCNDLDDTVLLVRNGSLLISDALEAFINFNRLALTTEYTCKVLNDSNGVIFFLKSAGEPSASICNIRVPGVSSITKWAFSSDKIDTYSQQYNLINIIQEFEERGNQVITLREQLKGSYSDFLIADQAFRYVCVYAHEFAEVLLSTDLKRMIKCIRRFVYVQDRANFIYDVLIAFFGALVTHGPFAPFDAYSVSVVMLGKVQELRITEFLKNLDSYYEIMKGYKNSVVFVEDGKLFVKIW